MAHDNRVIPFNVIPLFKLEYKILLEFIRLFEGTIESKVADVCNKRQM
jgi:hypothetical protein